MSSGRRRLAAALLTCALLTGAAACGSDGSDGADDDAASSSLPPTSTSAASNRQAWAACVNQVTALLLAVVDPTSGVDPEQIAREAGEDEPEIQVFRRLAPEVEEVAAAEGASRARIRANNLAVSECRKEFPV